MVATTDSVSLILIVDDEPSGRRALESLLLGQGYGLAFAASADEALTLARGLEPDLILLDVMMPGTDGIEALRQLRSIPRIGEIPVILVTSLDDRASRLAGLEAGADDFVAKPIDRLELRTRVRTIMRLNRFRKLRDAVCSLSEAYDATLEGWVRALDLREHQLEGHSERVAEMTARLAREMGVEPADVVHIYRGALLHDIGKIAIPDAILLKAGPLDEAEWTIMRRHPDYARAMIEPIAYLRPALEIPYCHHERWDGKGYPRGLRAEAIPKSARIFSAVDVWDALSSDRPYRACWDRARVSQYLLDNSGTLFDPDVVTCFVKLLGEDEIRRTAASPADLAQDLSPAARPDDPGILAAPAASCYRLRSETPPARIDLTEAVPDLLTIPFRSIHRDRLGRPYAERSLVNSG
ncbi:HD domain-containing phosphohydrolase [Aquisphaera giovannonii]|uniref:HD domain-containing phosphohydrolase n=1 Tax=Aquisphaera giovannonii TaxID=406548 RepID=UPI001AEFE3C3|nr:HD domain-containing phosphohydrolase [Aquisphaera giovannonii]